MVMLIGLLSPAAATTGTVAAGAPPSGGESLAIEPFENEPEFFTRITVDGQPVSRVEVDDVFTVRFYARNFTTLLGFHMPLLWSTDFAELLDNDRNSAPFADRMNVLHVNPNPEFRLYLVGPDVNAQFPTFNPAVGYMWILDERYCC